MVQYGMGWHGMEWWLPFHPAATSPRVSSEFGEGSRGWVTKEKNPRQSPLLSAGLERGAGFHPKGEDGHSGSKWLWAVVAANKALEGQL